MTTSFEEITVTKTKSKIALNQLKENGSVHSQNENIKIVPTSFCLYFGKLCNIE